MTTEETELLGRSMREIKRRLTEDPGFPPEFLLPLCLWIHQGLCHPATVASTWAQKSFVETMVTIKTPLYMCTRMRKKGLTLYAWPLLNNYYYWKPNFFPSIASVSSTLVWVQFPKMPIEFFNKELLMYLGNLVGKATKVDQATT